MAILDPTSRFQEAGEVTADKSQMTGGAVRQTRSVWHCPQRRHQEESRKMERLGVDQARHLAGVGTSGDRQMGPGEQTLHGMFRGQRRPRALAVPAPAHVLALSCRRLPPAFRMAWWKGCAVTTERGRVNVLFSGGRGYRVWAFTLLFFKHFQSFAVFTTHPH